MQQEIVDGQPEVCPSEMYFHTYVRADRLGGCAGVGIHHRLTTNYRPCHVAGLERRTGLLPIEGGQPEAVCECNSVSACAVATEEASDRVEGCRPGVGCGNELEGS